MKISPTVTIEVGSAREASKRIVAYRDLFAFTGELITYVQGTFKARNGDLVFLRRATLAEITNRSIKIYDRVTDAWYGVTSSDPTFELIIAH